VEIEIGVKPADDYVFDPIEGPTQPAGRIGLNDALKARLKAAVAALGQRPGGTPLAAPVDPPIAVQTQSFVSGLFSPDKFSSLTLLMSALRNAQGTTSGNTPSERDFNRRLFLVPDAHVSRLQVGTVFRDGTQADGPAVTGIELFASGVRKVLLIKPTCTVVLALGAIESTRLALESFPTAPHRENQDEIMGRNLMAHLRFDFPFQVDRAAFAAWVSANTGSTLRDKLQTASFHVQADTDDGRFHLQVYGTGDNSGNPEGLLYRMIPDPDVARRLADQQSPDTINLIFRACGEMKADRGTPVRTPNTSWIDLASRADRDELFDHARAFVNYADQSGAGIWGRMRRACVDLANEMGAIAIPAEDRHEVGSTWHDSGTLFMGDDLNASVTDTNGHFHHIINAACVDQALFPTVGSANPVLTGLCLARKVAEAIVDRRVGVSPPSPQEAATERNQGFVFLLENGNENLWRPNDPRFGDDNGRPRLLDNGTILEVHGDAGLGVLIFDDPQPFGDFELRLQWKAFRDPATGDASANSGVFLRAPDPSADLDGPNLVLPHSRYIWPHRRRWAFRCYMRADDFAAKFLKVTEGGTYLHRECGRAPNFYDRAIEIQIDDTGYDSDNRRFHSPFHRTGAVYRIAPARMHAQKVPSTENSAGFWNEYSITAKGDRVTVLLNGHLVSEGDVPAALPAAGKIGLQYHTGKVQFRSIRVRRI
jgi:hypothetical protein